MSRLILNNTLVTPSTPASGKIALYADGNDKRLHIIDDAGIISAVSQSPVKRNLLINGGFAFAQRQVPTTLTTYSNTTGRAYSADRWGGTNENASFQFQDVDAIAAPETNLVSRFYGRFKKITSPGKMVISQVIEGQEVASLRGRVVRLQCKMRYTVAASMVVRLGLFQLTSAGTVDTMPATFISAFGAAATDPTFGTNLSAITPITTENGASENQGKVGVTCTLTAAWVRYSASFLVPTDCKNLIAVVWTRDLPAANDELNITEAGLYDGPEITDWTPVLHTHELTACRRYYQKTFPSLTAPAQSAGVAGNLRGGVAIAGAVATSSVLQWRFPIQMRAAPTITFFNPSAANAFLRNIARSTDASATTAASTTLDGTDINATGLAAWTVGDQIGVHMTADAEL